MPLPARQRVGSFRHRMPAVRIAGKLPPSAATVPQGSDAAQLVFLERIEALYRPRIESVASGLVVGAVLALALLRVHTWPTVLAWYLGICVVQFGRGALFRPSRFKAIQIGDPLKAGHRYVMDVAAAGLYWGGTLALLVKPDDLLTQSFMAWAIGGMAVGSITVHAYHPPVMYTFLACLLAPFALRLVWLGDFSHLYLGLGLLLLGAYLALYGRFHARTLSRSIALRHENRQLIDQLERERQAAVALQAQAEAASQSKSRFFAGASHDLRQPLQALSLYASVLSESHLPTDLRQVSLRIGQSVHVLEELFEGVLDIAHVEAGGMTIRREPVSLQLLMNRALLLFSGEALDKGLSIKAMPCRHWVLGDQLALQRIVSNLVANAVRHTTKGRVVMGARQHGANVRLQVLDTGPGIDTNGKERIFEEFYRLPSTQGHGFGLGLATVKRLCDAAHYPLGVESTPGRGSTFWVELALTVPPGPELTPASPAPLEAGAAPLRILLVEDDPNVREAMARTLHSWGHVCHSAASGEDALALLRADAKPWNLLISDYNLPAQTSGHELNGVALIAQARQLVGAELPALLMSGTLTGTLREQAQAMGFIALSKPVRPMHLRAVIDRIRADGQATGPST